MIDEETTTEESSNTNTRKRRKRSKGSQTEEDDCESTCHGCQKMAATLAAINTKLDKALNCIEEIEELKQKHISLEKKNVELETSLTFAYTSIAELEKKLAAQELVSKELDEGVKSLIKQAVEEKQRGIKLESHSRRNNLNFFNIPEQKDESFQKSEKILRRFMEVQLQISKEDVGEISLERVHRFGKPSPDKPRPMIAKFTFHKDKEFILASAKNLFGTEFAIARDFPKELIYDKLYINGQLYKQ